MHNSKIMGMVIGAFFVMLIIFVAFSSITTAGNIHGKDKSSSNQTFVACAMNASIVKDTCVNNSKTTNGLCRITARDTQGQNTNQINAQLKLCNTQFNNEYRACITAFKKDKKDCQKLNHTFRDEMHMARYN